MTISRPSAIYTPENCRVAYQLNWALTLFWKALASREDWKATLKNQLEGDGIRLLEYRIGRKECSQLLVSTKPNVRPADVVRFVKGRLQYLVQSTHPKAFRRNYDLHSVGSTRREKVESHVASQLEHHAETGQPPRSGAIDLQWTDPEIDLSKPRFTAHARNRCNYHLVFVQDWRRCEQDQKVLERTKNMIRKAAAIKGHLVSRIALLSDHVHLALGCSPMDSPAEVALSYLNNLAFVQGMKPVYMHGFYIGTVGEYDLGAVQSTK